MGRTAVLAMTGILAAGGCASITDRTLSPPAQDRLMTLRDYLSGSFSSAAQAARDESYFHIAMHATPMWTWRDDGPWLYVEQAVAHAGDRPFRQRVYKLERAGDGTYRARMFVFGDPLEHAGAWKSGSPLSEMSPADLEERVGCSIRLEWQDDAFAGSTTGAGCPSEQNGAAYATIELLAGPERVLVWDRGFDATGRQVWGPTEGGYEFIRED